MNPAHSFAPALTAGEIGSLWIYVIGPAAEATLAALCYRLLRGDGGAAREPVPKETRTEEAQ